MVARNRPVAAVRRLEGMSKRCGHRPVPGQAPACSDEHGARCPGSVAPAWRRQTAGGET
jgi:hypothetical protein